jgi:hypothetical protein
MFNFKQRILLFAEYLQIFLIDRLSFVILVTVSSDRGALLLVVFSMVMVALPVLKKSSALIGQRHV